MHGSDSEYDYNYISEKRKLIIKILSGLFITKQSKELIIFELDMKSLKEVVTLKAEKANDPSFTRMPKTFGVQATKYLAGGDAADEINIRLNAHRGTIYSKVKSIDQVYQDDFKFIKVLGRGAFGKVTLVEFKKNNKLYAMKTLKKDVLIDQDQIENTLLEKKILENLEHPFLVGMDFCFQTTDRLYFVMPFMRSALN